MASTALQRCDVLGRIATRAILALAVCGLTQSLRAFSGTPHAEPKDLSSVLEGVRAKYKAPALAGAIVRGNDVVGLGVCGVRVQGEPTPATLDDRFPIGSCSKNAARLVLARLDARGVLKLDATIGEAMGGAMRDDYKAATVADLLAHKAGIKAYENIGPKITPEVFDRTGTPAEQRMRFARHVLGLEPAAKPRTRFVYSNAGFCVAAAMAEKSAGKSWDVLVGEEVFTPLGLKTAVVGTDPSASLRGHERTPQGFEPVKRVRPRLAVMEPAGGICLSIRDFGMFAAAEAQIAAGRPTALLDAQGAKRIAQAGPADMPGGMQPGAAFFGGDGEFSAAFAVWPEAGVGIAVAMNGGDGDEICTAAIEAIQAAAGDGLSRPGATPAVDPSVAPPTGPRFGFAVGAEDDGGMTVQSVVEGSIAEKAGLKAGDTIVSINGTRASELDPEKLRGLLTGQSLTLVVESEGVKRTVEMKKPPAKP